MGSSVALSSSLLSCLALECGLLGQLATALALPPLGKFLGLHSSQAFPTDIIMERRTSRTSESLVPFDMRTKRGMGARHRLSCRQPWLQERGSGEAARS